MKILLVASEVAGFAKTGGLADVCAALPRALARRGHDCAVVMPLYRAARRAGRPLQPTPHQVVIPMGKRTFAAPVWRSTLPDSDVPIYLIDQQDYFDRDDPTLGRGLYHMTMIGGRKVDYPDNAERFAFLARAALELLPMLGWRPDVIHANDWQTGLVPVYLRETYCRRQFAYDGIRSLFTIHNIAYQGNFPITSTLNVTGLDPRLVNSRQLEFYGGVSYLKAGVVFADRVSTVSPSYAKEIQTPYFGCGMQGILTERRHVLTGIVNGIETREWDPARDRHLAAGYDVDSVATGKPICKAALQRHFHLDVDPRMPILGVVARLADQKGIDLILQTAEAMVREDDVQLVVLGEGDPHAEHQLRELHYRLPNRVGLHIGFDERLAHQIEAGADLFLMPSVYEPAGLNQLYSLRYGTVPIVKATGGLNDTITDATDETLAEGTATGFRFRAHTAWALRETVQRALALYRNDPARWLELVRTGMRQDWSWDRSAVAYEELFRAMVSGS